MNIKRCLLIGLIPLLVAGCNDQKQDLQAFTTDVRSRQSAPIPVIPEISDYAPFAYIAGDRRSPFAAEVEVPVAVDASGSTIHPDIDRPRGPLEAFQLDSLSMVGMIAVAGTRYALILAPDGVVYQTTIGDYAGKDYGKVTTISNTGLTLSELVPNGMGGYMKRPASIPFSQ